MLTLSKQFNFSVLMFKNNQKMCKLYELKKKNTKF